MSDDVPKPSPPDFFTRAVAETYDDRNGQLAAISDNLHFLVRLVLEGAPANARILCVGVGTGAEILSLAKAYPGWTFVGVDPSAAMLAVCRERLAQAGVIERCELIHGTVERAPEGANFDAVLAMLVAHFVGADDRTGFYRNIRDRLKPGGIFVSAEISFDLEVPRVSADAAELGTGPAADGRDAGLAAVAPENTPGDPLRVVAGRDRGPVEGNRVRAPGSLLPGVPDPRMVRNEIAPDG